MKKYKVRIVDTINGIVMDCPWSVRKAKKIMHDEYGTPYSKLKVYHL